MDFIETLKSIAPIAASMVPGPWGALAKVAIGKVFNHEGDKPPTEDEIEGYLQDASPEQLITLKNIDADLKIKLKDLNIKEKDLVYKDKNSARDMQKANKSKMPAVLAILLTIGFFGSLAYVMKFDIPKQNENMVYYMLGALNMAWLAAMQFYHGSTQDSHNKTEMIGKK